MICTIEQLSQSAPGIITVNVSGKFRHKDFEEKKWEHMEKSNVPMVASGTISALLADVDGTTVTKDKVLHRRAIEAVRKLDENGIAFFITSGRPPRGMRMLVEPL